MNNFDNDSKNDDDGLHYFAKTPHFMHLQHVKKEYPNVKDEDLFREIVNNFDKLVTEVNDLKLLFLNFNGPHYFEKLKPKLFEEVTFNRFFSNKPDDLSLIVRVLPPEHAVFLVRHFQFICPNIKLPPDIEKILVDHDRSQEALSKLRKRFSDTLFHKGKQSVSETPSDTPESKKYSSRSSSPHENNR